MKALFGKRKQWDKVGSKQDEARLINSKRIVVLVFFMLGAGFLWAGFAELDEVSNGQGRIVPTSREQVVQSLEGGILASIHVRQDEIVEAGQILAQLDPTKSESDVEEMASKLRASLASAARLRAEVTQGELVFPPELDGFDELKDYERALFEARKASLNDSMEGINRVVELLKGELELNRGLSDVGATSKVELIRLERQIAESELKLVDLRSQHVVQAREELAKTNSEISTLTSSIRGRTDTLQRHTIRSPVRGIVKNVEVSTIGGVIPPNGKLMEIVPMDEQLLVEARINPRDIAYIHLNQRANVKVTAYDYSIYGSLDGNVVSISPDTIKDETKPDNYFYRVFIKTEKDALENSAGTRFPIVPGMMASVDIHTGQKTVLEYILKPFNKAQEALRER